MPDVTIRELWTYPVKGCQGVRGTSLEVGPIGIAGDRAFSVWQEGKLVDQIETPQLASLAVGFDHSANTLRFEHAEYGVYDHEVRDVGAHLETQWVLDHFEVHDQGDEVAGWLSRVLGKPVRLASPGNPWKINFPIPQMRMLHQKPKQSFYSASPVSLASRSSLGELNERLQEPVGMDRFRVNVVIDGLEPWAEDELVSVAHSEVELLNVTPAERCIIITTNQETGERPKSDLLKVLGSYRRKKKEDRFGSGITFGLYMAVGQGGTLRVGDSLSVTD